MEDVQWVICIYLQPHEKPARIGAKDVDSTEVCQVNCVLHLLLSENLEKTVEKTGMIYDSMMMDPMRPKKEETNKFDASLNLEKFTFIHLSDSK